MRKQAVHEGRRNCLKANCQELVEAYPRGARAANRAAFKEPEESSDEIVALEGEAKEAAERAIEDRPAHEHLDVRRIE